MRDFEIQRKAEAWEKGDTSIMFEKLTFIQGLSVGLPLGAVLGCVGFQLGYWLRDRGWL